MKVSFQNIKLFTWYNSRYESGEYFFVYSKKPDNKIAIFNYSGFVVQSKTLDQNWNIYETTWRPSMHQSELLMKYIFESELWFRIRQK